MMRCTLVVPLLLAALLVPGAASASGGDRWKEYRKEEKEYYKERKKRAEEHYKEREKREKEFYKERAKRGYYGRGYGYDYDD